MSQVADSFLKVAVQYLNEQNQAIDEQIALGSRLASSRTGC
jgi:hypothetical protein